MHPQIPLPLKLRDEYTFANFVEGDNGLICQALKKPNEPFVFLAGESGYGKTHLLQAACQFATHENLSTGYLPLKELLSYSADVLSGMQQIDLICIDDIEAICGNSIWETALFNLFNKAKQQGRCLIVSASTTSSQLPIQLNDLKSRLGSGLPLNIQMLNDNEVQEALTIRAKNLGLSLSTDVCRYLLTRFPRNLPVLLSLLEQLDQATLSAQKKLTIPFLKQFVEKLD
ncbi:MAG: DnaA regulatory inactivator Hda [Cycloclasticus sp. symbiont of Poecilosclerida sp. M]|nr:MAG: DnaA regulatory inactivator Hda [Cycloclasticus sp. symbiont of Poecilosclerida sp. M]